MTHDERFAGVVDALIQLSEYGKHQHCKRCQNKSLGTEGDCNPLCTERMISQRVVSVGMARKAGNTQRMITYLNSRHAGKYLYLAPNQLIAEKYARYGAERVAAWDAEDISAAGVRVIAVDPQAHFKGVYRQRLFDHINKLSTNPIIILVGT